ncbi:heterokaryon incompatibility protein-domain-containing protein [Xylariaceae sp. FL0255]|nr:heterokaryon incompatibility protein-domain-containing protein [Xylariaceae sp. FL0255]
MWLINVKTGFLEEFIGRAIPQYAILSHTWEAGQGYRKFEQTCQQAAHDRILYVWVDTCCTDKSSSAELSEAINSMFPTVSDRLGGALSLITSIDLQVFRGIKPLLDICVAQKMSWAHSCEATRIEDEAYSLIGLFDIAMPLLYGEEKRASWPDPSIFAWYDDDAKRDKNPKGRTLPNNRFSGVLAASPKNFRRCGDLSKLSDRSIPEFSISNQGIKFRASFALQRGQKSPFALPVCRSNDATIRHTASK